MAERKWITPLLEPKYAGRKVESIRSLVIALPDIMPDFRIREDVQIPPVKVLCLDGLRKQFRTIRHTKMRFRFHRFPICPSSHFQMKIWDSVLAC